MKIIEESILVPHDSESRECSLESAEIISYESTLVVEIENIHRRVRIMHTPDQCLFLLHNDHFRHEISYRMRTILLRNLRKEIFGLEE